MARKEEMKMEKEYRQYSSDIIALYSETIKKLLPPEIVCKSYVYMPIGVIGITAEYNGKEIIFGVDCTFSEDVERNCIIAISKTILQIEDMMADARVCKYWLDKLVEAEMGCK